MNALMVIHPYKEDGVWVFDDDSVGLIKEPFISGIPEIIEDHVKSFPNAEEGFTCIFSSKPFPTASVTLQWMREETGGNWYKDVQTKKEGWLCPALFEYFSEAPEKIYIEVKSKES